MAVKNLGLTEADVELTVVCGVVGDGLKPMTTLRILKGEGLATLLTSSLLDEVADETEREALRDGLVTLVGVDGADMEIGETVRGDGNEAAARRKYSLADARSGSLLDERG